jgi:hypothetical protein
MRTPMRTFIQTVCESEKLKTIQTSIREVNRKKWSTMQQLEATTTHIQSTMHYSAWKKEEKNKIYSTPHLFKSIWHSNRQCTFYKTYTQLKAHTSTSMVSYNGKGGKWKGKGLRRLCKSITGESHKWMTAFSPFPMSKNHSKKKEKEKKVCNERQNHPTSTAFSPW